MAFLSKSLLTIISKLKCNLVDVHINKSTITIHVDLTKTHFSKISMLLHTILNKFEILYLIRIKGIPYCLMPDAVHHLIYKRQGSLQYRQDTECKKCQHYHNCPGWINNTTVDTRPKAIKNLPREIVFELTTACNLNCPSCFSSKSVQELSLDRIKSLINECVYLGIHNVRFTGGEPLLYPHLDKALAYAKSKNLHVTLNTNATIISSKNHHMLKHHVDDLLISLQGFNPESEKILTQTPLNFSVKLHNIVQLNAKIAVVRLGTIISQPLIKNFLKYFHLIHALGIRHWGLFRPMVKTPSEIFHITSQHYMKFIKMIRLKQLQDNNIMIANPLPFCITEDMNLSEHVLSGAEYDDGHSRLMVDAQGFLKPSYFITKNLGITIKEAWENPFIKKLHSMDYLPEKCQNCRVLKWCKGGSRHWAKIAYKNYFTCDPLMPKEACKNS